MCSERHRGAGWSQQSRSSRRRSRSRGTYPVSSGSVAPTPAATESPSGRYSCVAGTGRRGGWRGPRRRRERHRTQHQRPTQLSATDASTASLVSLLADPHSMAEADRPDKRGRSASPLTARRLGGSSRAIFATAASGARCSTCADAKSDIIDVLLRGVCHSGRHPHDRRRHSNPACLQCSQTT